MSTIISTENFYEYDGVPMQFFHITPEDPKADFIFIGGISDPIQNHSDILKEIAKKGYRVWALNMPGHGKSGFIYNVDWEILVDIVRAFTLGMGIDEHIIGGFSMGGGIALKYAAEYPKDVKEIRVLSPLCFRVPSIKDLVIGGSQFVFDFLENRHRNPSNKEPPSGETYPIYYIQNYVSLIRDFKLNTKELQGKPIHVVTGLNDTIIKPMYIKQAFLNMPWAKIIFLEELSHDIYFIELDMIKEIGENLVK